MGELKSDPFGNGVGNQTGTRVSNGVSIGNKRILLVEDEAIIGLAKKEMLQNEGLQVEMVHSGEKAVALFTGDRESPPFDLVLMDIDLGRGIDGTEAAEVILQYNEVPIVFISSHTEPEIVEKTEKITSYGYVVKKSGDTALITSIKMAFKLFASRQREREKEAALLESEAKFRRIAENVDDIIYRYEIYPKKGFSYVNSAVEKLTGYTPEEYYNDPDIRMKTLHSDDYYKLSLDKESPDTKEETSKDYSLEKTIQLRFLHKKGKTIWVEIKRKPVFNKRGRLIAYEGIVRDISSWVEEDRKLRESEEQARKKLNTIIAPDSNIDNLTLSDVFDVKHLKALFEDLYRISNIHVSIVDMAGKVLVAIGWQDMCQAFHRVNSITAQKCWESDLELSPGVAAGEHNIYRCKNNLYHAVTPIVAGEKQLGNLIVGQFLLAEEPVDLLLFKQQALEYGFDENEYLEALKTIPRLDRNTIQNSMSFLTKLTSLISVLGVNNIKLAQTLVQQHFDKH